MIINLKSKTVNFRQFTQQLVTKNLKNFHYFWIKSEEQLLVLDLLISINQE